MDPEFAPELPVARTFGAKRAALILGASVFVQFLVGFVVGMVVGIYHGYQNAAHHLHLDAHEISVRVQKDILLPIGVLSIILGAWVVYQMVRRDFPGSIRDGAFEALGGVRSSTRDIFVSALVGVALTLTTLFIVIPLFPPDSHSYMGPMSAAAGASPVGRYFWIFIAVLLAPPSEEFLFRGVLYAGFSRSWGSLRAAICVSVIFVSLHLFEVIGYLPALFGISGLAIGTMIVRQRTGSLIAPMAMHIAYNLTLAIIVFGFAAK